MRISDNGHTTIELDNGLRVFIKNMQSRLFAGKLKFHYGTIHERKTRNGTAHLNEHLLLMTGCRKYTEQECYRLADELYECNAGTSLCETEFIAKGLKEDAGLWLDFIREQVFHPRITAKSFEQEKEVVLREIADYKGTAGYDERRQTRNFLFGAGSPFCIELFGKEEAVRSLTLEEIRRFRRKGFSASNAELYLAGGIPDGIEGAVAKCFGKEKIGKKLKRTPKAAPPLRGNKTIYAPAPDLINTDCPELSTAEIALCFLAPPEYSHEMYPTVILNSLLGNGASSRIFQQVRKKQGLAYSINSEYDGSNNQGIIEINGRVLARDLEQAIDEIFRQIRLLTHNINKAHIESIKRAELYLVLSSFENPAGAIRAVEAEEEYGITPREHLAMLSKVTADDLKETARKYFPASREDGRYALLVRNPLIE